MSYQPPPPPPPTPYGGVPVPMTNPKAMWSMILGIVSLACCCGLWAGVPAIILSRMADGEIASTGQGGAGMAKAGLILGIIATVLSVIGFILWITGIGNFSYEFNLGG